MGLERSSQKKIQEITNFYNFLETTYSELYKKVLIFCTVTVF